jgi:hypothetical protein
MAQMTVQLVVDAGTPPAFAAANLADTADVGNGHNTVLEVVNTDTNVKTVTITSYATLDNGDPAPSHAVAVPATTGKVRIPLRQSYNKGDGTGAQIAYSGTGGVTGVTSALVRVQ